MTVKELTAEEAFRCASFGIEPQPVMPYVIIDRYPYVLNAWLWGRYIPRDDLPVNYQRPLFDIHVDSMARMPERWRPANPYYQKTHLNAPGTVRAWFRAMRAADFERDCRKWTAFSPFNKTLGPWDDGSGLLRFTSHEPYLQWTLFDTRKVIDRETAAHYAKPDPDTFTFYLLAPPPLFVIKLADRGKFCRIDNVKAPDGD